MRSVAIIGSMNRFGATLDAARAAKAKASARFSDLAAVNGVGLTPVTNGYAIKILLASPVAPEVELPQEIDGVPVIVEIVGPISKRGT